ARVPAAGAAAEVAALQEKRDRAGLVLRHIAADPFGDAEQVARLGIAPIAALLVGLLDVGAGLGVLVAAGDLQQQVARGGGVAVGRDPCRGGAGAQLLGVVARPIEAEAA